MKKYIRISTLTVLHAALAIAAAAVLSAPAYAYPASAYGDCTYNASVSDCQGQPDEGSTDQPGTDTPGNAGTDDQAQTISNMPSGLTVAINLHDGQVLPAEPYTIVVTPLNGRGTTFQEVSMSANGVSVATFTPDATGTASWIWSPAAGSYALSFVVADSTNTTIITMGVTVRGALANGTTVQDDKPDTGTTGATPDAIRRFARSIPPEVLRAFPFVLFIILLVNALVLIAIALHEYSTHRRLRRLTDWMQQVSQDRTTFSQLTAHYLNTPLTLLRGGLELIPQNYPTHRAISAQIRSISAAASHLLQSSDAAKDYALRQPQSQRLLTNPRFYIPSLLVALLALAAEYLSIAAGAISVQESTRLERVLVYVAAGLVFYGALRWLQSVRLKRRVTQSALQAAESLAADKERFIHECLELLRRPVAQLAAETNNIPDQVARTCIDDGCKRLQGIIEKFALASALQGTHCTKQATAVDLGGMLHNAVERYQSSLRERDVSIQMPPSSSCPCRDKRLLAYVLDSLLDNAISYCNQASTVTIQAIRSRRSYRLTICDTGSDNTASQRSLLLEPFWKREGALQFDHEGMGFDLYLCKLMLSYLGGTLSIKADGPVTTATIDLPQSA